MAKGTSKKLVTKKRKEEIILPGQTFIYQSNRVTNGRFEGFTLTQYKLLAAVMLQFQKAIQLEMEGKDWRQGDLFTDENNKDMVRVGIPLSYISKPNQYPDIVAQAKGLMNAKATLKSSQGDDYISIASIVTRIDVPKKEKGQSVLYMHLYKDVAHTLIQIEKNIQGKPKNFTRFLYEVAISATNKYTPKLYMILCSWRAKGGFYITLEKLRRDLGLEDDEYPNYYDFKKRILIPVQSDLEKKADCWFNCSDKTFEDKKGKKVVGLNFKVIVPEAEEDKTDKADYCRQLLRMHAGFKDEHLAQLEPVFRGDFNIADVLFKIQELVFYVKENNSKISNPVSYIIKSMLNQFK